MNRINQTPLVTDGFFSRVVNVFYQNRVVLIALAALALFVIAINRLRHHPFTPISPQRLPQQDNPRRQHDSGQSLVPHQTIAPPKEKKGSNDLNVNSFPEESLTSPATSDAPQSLIQEGFITSIPEVAPEIELMQSILTLVLEDKYSGIVTLIKQENLSEQRELFEPLFQSMSEQSGKNPPLIVRRRYQCISIIFMQKVFSESIKPLDPSAQIDVLAKKQAVLIRQFSAIINALTINDSNRLLRTIQTLNKACSRSLKSLAGVSEAQETIKSRDHLVNFKEYSQQLETMAHQFGEIAEEIALLDEDQLQQRLLEISRCLTL